MLRLLLVLPVIWAAAAEGGERFALALDPLVSCPSRAELLEAFGPLAAPGPAAELREVRVTQSGGAAVTVELRSPKGEVLAAHTLPLQMSVCREVAQTIALLASAWSEAFPLAAIGQATGPEGTPALAPVAAPAPAPTPESPPPFVLAPEPAPVVSPPSPAPFTPGPFSLRASGVGVLDVAPGDLGGGGQLAVELGLGRHFSVGLSGALLSNQTATDPNNPRGSLLLHRQRYEIFGGYTFAPLGNQWLSLQLGAEDQHFIAQTFGYEGPLHGARDDPAFSLQALYGHALVGPLFAFAQAGADVLLVHEAYQVQDFGATQTLFTVSAVSFDLQLGLGLRFL